MKPLKKPASKKLLTKFDMELKDILLNDLKSFVAKNPFILSNPQAMGQKTLYIA
jgi:hypothetical protein